MPDGVTSGSIGDAFVDIGARQDAFNRQLQTAEKRFQAFGRNLARIGRTMTIGITLPIVAFSAFSTKAAADAEEVRSKFAKVFEGVPEEAERVAVAYAKSFGLASTTAKELLANTGDLLTGFKFTDKQALDLSKQVNELAGDLTSFQNVQGGVTRASEALTKALLGERESAKLLGVTILEKDVDRQVELNRSKQITFASERQAKAYATLQIAVDQSGKAVGDYNRTQDSTANSMRRVRERMKEVNEEWGRLLINVLKIDEKLIALAGTLESLAGWFTNLSEEEKKATVALVGILAAAGPVLWVLGNLTIVITGLAGLFTKFGLAIGPVLIGLAAFAGLAVLVVKNWKLVSRTFLLTINRIAAGFAALWIAIRTGFENMGKAAASFFLGIKVEYTDVFEEWEKSWEKFAEREAEILKGMADDVEEAEKAKRKSFEKTGKPPPGAGEPPPAAARPFETRFVGPEQIVREASRMAFELKTPAVQQAQKAQTTREKQLETEQKILSEVAILNRRGTAGGAQPAGEPVEAEPERKTRPAIIPVVGDSERKAQQTREAQLAALQKMEEEAKQTKTELKAIFRRLSEERSALAQTPVFGAAQY